MTNRRNGATSAAKAIEPIRTSIICPDEETVKKIVVASEGDVEAIQEQSMIDFDASPGLAPTPLLAWFGVPNEMVNDMENRTRADWMREHMEVNRRFGFSARAYFEQREAEERAAWSDGNAKDLLFRGGDFC